MTKTVDVPKNTTSRFVSVTCCGLCVCVDMVFVKHAILTYQLEKSAGSKTTKSNRLGHCLRFHFLVVYTGEDKHSERTPKINEIDISLKEPISKISNPHDLCLYLV